MGVKKPYQQFKEANIITIGLLYQNIFRHSDDKSISNRYVIHFFVKGILYIFALGIISSHPPVHVSVIGVNIHVIYNDASNLLFTIKNQYICFFFFGEEMV